MCVNMYIYEYMYECIYSCMYVCMYVRMYQSVRGFFFKVKEWFLKRKKTFKEEILRGFGGQHPQQGGLVGVWGTDFPYIEKNFYTGLNLK